MLEIRTGGLTSCGHSFRVAQSGSLVQLWVEIVLFLFKKGRRLVDTCTGQLRNCRARTCSNPALKMRDYDEQRHDQTDRINQRQRLDDD